MGIIAARPGPKLAAAHGYVGWCAACQACGALCRGLVGRVWAASLSCVVYVDREVVGLRERSFRGGAVSGSTLPRRPDKDTQRGVRMSKTPSGEHTSLPNIALGWQIEDATGRRASLRERLES